MKLRNIVTALSLIVVSGLLASTANAKTADFVLAKDGKPAATIVISKSPTLAAAFAARELQDHIKMISGAVLPIVSDDVTVTGPQILVGDSAAAKKLGVTGASFKSQEYGIIFKSDQLILIGKDNPAAIADGGISADGQGFPSFFDDKGTLDAVYEFLERHCGVRWYHPTSAGIVYSKSPTLAVRANSIRRMPDMKYTWITPTDLWLPKKSDYVTSEEATLWKLRMRIGGQKYEANHSFLGYYDRFLKSHPDWFAQGYTGQPPQLCYTNPELIKQVVQDARDYFDGKGAKPGAMAMGDYFGLVPMDSNNWCKCANCQAELAGCDVDNKQFSCGKASNYIWGFINKVAKEIKKTHPDKYIAGLAYWEYSYYPSNIKLEPNIAVQMCISPRNWYVPSVAKNDMSILNSWTQKEKSRPIYLWLYYNFPATMGYFDDYNVFPGYFAHDVAKQMRVFQKAGVRGIFLEHSSEFRESHLLDLPDVYVLLKMARDSRLSGNQIIDEFFARYYGAAAEPMKNVYCIIENAYYNPASYPEKVQKSQECVHQSETIAWETLGTKERMDKIGKLMEQAKQLAKTDEDKARVALFDEGVWQYMLAGYTNHPKRMQLRNTPIPSAKAAKVNAVGGDPSKVDWASATILNGWKKMSGDETARKCEARIAHDRQYFYAFLEEQVDTSKLISTDNVWHGDDWEMRFAKQRCEPSRQIIIGPEGKHAETAYGESVPAWNAGAVVISDKSSSDRWRVLVSIPLENLLPDGVKPGDKFYANFYRGVAWQSELLGWSPNFVGSFHELSRLGEITLE